jgi:ATP-binding cassette subfamily B protein
LSEQSQILPERDVSRNLSNLRPALAFLAPYRWHIVGASVALVVSASVTLSIGQGIRMVVDAGFAGGAGAVGTPALLTESLLVFAALVVLLTAGTYARYYLVSWIGERVSADIRRAVFDRLVSLHPGFFEANLPTEIQSRLTTDTTLLQTVIGSSVSVALRNLLMFVGGVGLLLVSNLKLSLVVLASAPIVIAPIVLFGRRVRRLSRSSQDTIARVGTYVGEAFRHIKVVQAFNHAPRDRAAFDAHVETAFDVAVQRIRQRAWLVALVMLLVLSAIATMVWMGGQDVLAGRTSPGELAAFIFYAFIVAGAVGSLSEVLSDLQRAAGATERLVELLEADSDLEEPEHPRALVEGNTVELAFDDVSFAYVTRPAARVLDGVSFRVEAGEMAALVGPSGAGKTTIFELALRFYDPAVGRVLLGGIDLRELSLESLRDAIGLVPQDAALFAGTVEANVRYGRVDASPEDVEQALAQANALDFVAALPEGLDTRIGEDGVGLSGGQRQRLAIARALLTQPRLLLLDEATSALDAQSEEAIREALSGLRGRCTVLIIAHRLSTVVAADRTLVLDGGRVVAIGRHAELLETSALYREFASIQLQRLDTLVANEVVGGAGGAH